MKTRRPEFGQGFVGSQSAAIYSDVISARMNCSVGAAQVTDGMILINRKS